MREKSDLRWLAAAACWLGLSLAVGSARAQGVDTSQAADRVRQARENVRVTLLEEQLQELDQALRAEQAAHAATRRAVGSPTDQANLEAQLLRLQRQLEQRDARLAALEAQLGAASSRPAPMPPVTAPPQPTPVAAAPLPPAAPVDLFAQMDAFSRQGYDALDQGDAEGAKRLFLSALRQDRTSRPALYGVALAYHALEDLERARIALDALLKAEPRDHKALALAGLVARGLGDGAQATFLLERALQEMPDNPVVLNNLGVVLSERGQIRDALRHLRQAIDLAPNYAEAQYNMARVLTSERRPRLREARQHYDRARDLGWPADFTIERQLY